MTCNKAYLLISQGYSVATTLLDITPLQHRVKDWVQLLLDVLNQQGLAKGKAVLYCMYSFRCVLALRSD